MAVGRIEVDGVGLYVEVDGPDDGTPVLFLHGVGSSARTWDWLPPAVTQGRRIVRVDQRGHGRSDHATGTYVLARYGADAVAVLRELVAGPALIVGHSLGGVVAWWVAQNHPELVTAVLLEDPPLLAAETPEGDAGRFRDVFHTVRATILDHRDARALGGGARGAHRHDPLGTRDAAASRRADGRRDRGARLRVSPARDRRHRRSDRRLDAGLDGHTAPSSPRRSSIVAADDALGAAFSSDDAVRLASAGQPAQVVRIVGSGHRIHQSRRAPRGLRGAPAAVPRGLRRRRTQRHRTMTSPPRSLSHASATSSPGSSARFAGRSTSGSSRGG